VKLITGFKLKLEIQIRKSKRKGKNTKEKGKQLIGLLGLISAHSLFLPRVAQITMSSWRRPHEPTSSLRGARFSLFFHWHAGPPCHLLVRAVARSSSPHANDLELSPWIPPALAARPQPPYPLHGHKLTAATPLCFLASSSPAPWSSYEENSPYVRESRSPPLDRDFIAVGVRESGQEASSYHRVCARAAGENHPHTDDNFSSKLRDRANPHFTADRSPVRAISGEYSLRHVH
jgi:hypothetical protein